MVLDDPLLELESPRDGEKSGQPLPPGIQNDPTHALKTAHTPGVTHSHPPNQECEQGSQGRLLGKSCEHGSPGRLPGKTCESSEGPRLLTFEDNQAPEVLPRMNLEQWEFSPEIVALMQGTLDMETFVNERGKHSEPLLLEGPEEKIPRKHVREDPSENSESGSGNSPPPKRSHEENFSPLDVDVPLLGNLGSRGGEDPPAVAAVHAADPVPAIPNPSMPQRPESTV